VRYPAPIGELAAYLSPDPGDGQKHPAIVWITGGDSNSIGELWEPAQRNNDQTAAAYRQAGIIMMFPSLRGGNDNPGKREGFFGEVDDVVAAADYLAKQPYVDPKRIYLGGHSTGGTLAMLVAESTDRFRTTFAFGPVHDVRAYGGQFVYHDTSNPREYDLRSPAMWLTSVNTPLFVIEGASGQGNVDALRAMAILSKNPKIHFLPVNGFDHFSVLAPMNELLASKIVADTGPTASISVSKDEVSQTK
jgi:dipeptidyl aminopeptidase/acylaminoacyl peptidase